MNLRLTSFLTVFVLLALAEQFWPARPRLALRWQRWTKHLLLSGLNLVLMRLCLASAAIGTAQRAQSHSLGLFNLLSLDALLETGWAIVLLDLALYWQHRLMHKVPLLWRLHRVHHADYELDVSSGVRFHPVEALLSMLFKMSLIALLGASVQAVMIFELSLSLFSLWTHSNLRLSELLEKALRPVVMTPALHRLHHAMDSSTQNHNYGFSTTIWDRLFGSYASLSQTESFQIEIGDRQWPDALQPMQWHVILWKIVSSPIKTPSPD